MDVKMLPNRPYLLRAFYDWIVDSGCTPYVVVNANEQGVEVPEQFIENGKIVLNASPQATRDLAIENHALTFRARFSGVTRTIFAPVQAVLAIYAVENGRGIVFNEENFDDQGDAVAKPSGKEKSAKKGKPHLRVVK
jgi:stringent starvation protein B